MSRADELHDLHDLPEEHDPCRRIRAEIWPDDASADVLHHEMGGDSLRRDGGVATRSAATGSSIRGETGGLDSHRRDD